MYNIVKKKDKDIDIEKAKKEYTSNGVSLIAVRIEGISEEYGNVYILKKMIGSNDIYYFSTLRDSSMCIHQCVFMKEVLKRY